MSNLPSVNSDTFEKDVLTADVPVLVDFSASWCGPCKALAPTVEALSKQYEGRVRFFQLDVDQARDTALKYGVMSVPTLIVFKGGEVVAQGVGNMPQNDIAQMLDGALAG